MPLILVPLFEFLSAAAYWLLGLFGIGETAVYAFMGGIIAWATRNGIVLWLLSVISRDTVVRAIAILIQIAVITAWGAFLEIFWVFFTGSSLRDIWNLNPLAGAPAGMLYLASSFFPLKFMFGTAFAYVTWRITCIQAAIVMCRTIKVMLGA